jgi:hypothetical protein
MAFKNGVAGLNRAVLFVPLKKQKCFADAQASGLPQMIGKKNCGG